LTDNAFAARAADKFGHNFDSDGVTMSEPPRELVRSTLGVLFIGVLIVASFWVMRPFIAATVWATMIAVTTWPALKWFEARLWQRRSLAVLVMTLLLLLVLVVPLMLAVVTIVGHLDDIAAKAAALAQHEIPPPPTWIKGLPLIGGQLAQLWEQAEQIGAKGLALKLAPYADDIGKWFVSQAGSIGSMFVQFVLTVVISAVMYSGGEAAARAAHRFAWRLAGVQGESVVTLAGQAIRGVALGVGVTALVQAGLGGIGLAIAGVPLAGPLTAVMLLLCIAQLGPALVLFPAVAWLYWSGDNGWGTFLLVWSLVVVALDNFLRPVLIKRGADLPLLLIFSGVIGGLLAFGLVGIFVGPVVLAVVYTLLGAWMGSAGPQSEDT
jgi:predicted PurR-regulated permease PerM